MSFLNDLVDEQRSLLMRLPYRVGLFVSQSDDTGGEQSDEQELVALSNILTGYAGEIFVCETVQYIISETMRHKDNWDDWQQDLGDVTADCKRAVDLLADVVDEKEVNAFKQHLMEIGEAVATAFREIETSSFIDELKLKMAFTILEYKAKRAGHAYKTYEEFLNISPSERKALVALRDALDLEYAI